MSVTIRPHRRGGWEADNRASHRTARGRSGAQTRAGVVPLGRRTVGRRSRTDPVSAADGSTAAHDGTKGGPDLRRIRLEIPGRPCASQSAEAEQHRGEGHDHLRCASRRRTHVTSAPALEPRAAVARGPRPARGVRPPPRPDRRGSARPAVLPPRRRAAPPDAEPGVHARHRSHTGARHRRQRRCLFTSSSASSSTRCRTATPAACCRSSTACVAIRDLTDRVFGRDSCAIGE